MEAPNFSPTIPTLPITSQSKTSVSSVVSKSTTEDNETDCETDVPTIILSGSVLPTTSVLPTIISTGSGSITVLPTKSTTTDDDDDETDCETEIPTIHPTVSTTRTFTSDGVPTTQTLTTKLPPTTNQHTETEVVSITYTGGGQTFTTYLTQSGEICDETVTLTITTTCPLTTVAPGGQIYTTTVTVITTHTVYPDDWEDDGYEGEDNAGGSASGSSDDGEWEWYEEDDGECVPTGGSSSGSGTGSWWGSGAGSSGGTTSGSGSGSSSNSGASSGGTWGGSGNDYVCPGEEGYDDEEPDNGGSWWGGSGSGSSSGSSSGVSSGDSGSSSVTGGSSGSWWGGSGNDYVCPGEDGYDDEDDQTPEPECDDEDDSWDDDEECDTQAAKEVVNSVTVAAESVYPSTTAASLTTSWISTQTAQSVTQIENIGGKVSASGLFVVLGLLLI